MIVAKFGGSSLADAAQFRRVRDIALADSRRQGGGALGPGQTLPQDERSPICFTSATRPGRRGEPLPAGAEVIRGLWGRSPKTWVWHWIWTAFSSRSGSRSPGEPVGLLRQPGRVCQRPVAGGISGFSFLDAAQAIVF